MRYKKSFSLLEVLLSISIIAIFAFMAFPKLLINKSQIDIKKLKADIGTIRLGIISENYSLLLRDKNTKLKTLDNAKINTSHLKLFDNIITYPPISTSTNENKINHWIKIQENKYKYVLSDIRFIQFEYIDDKFVCNQKDDICLKINM